MLFKKTNQKQAMRLNFAGATGEIRFGKNEAVERQISMIGLMTQDLQIMNSLQPFVLAQISVIVDRFYKNLEYEPSLLHIINDHSSIERLKSTLKQHITEMFSGVIDEAYFVKRIKIANMHVRIGLQTKWYMCAFQELLLSLFDIIEENLSDRDDCLLATRAVTKIMNFEQQIVLEAYDAESNRLKAVVEEQKMTVRGQVATATESLAAISEQTNAALHELITQSNDIVTHVNTGTELSELTKQRAEHGKEQLQSMSSAMVNIDRSVNEITRDVTLLAQTLQQMQEIAHMVTEISSQTNLLSLNAAIEAARAGEYGRGFAVVANEVRKLSDQTKNSVNNVSVLIQNTNAHVDQLKGSLAVICAEVEKGNADMRITEDYFEQILNTMSDTMAHNHKIHHEVMVVVQVVHELGDAFEEVARSADSLTMIAQDMN